MGRFIGCLGCSLFRQGSGKATPIVAAPRMLLLIIVAVISAQRFSARQSREITITEPGIYKLADLFKKADVVAILKIVSGDTENYDCAVYKAVVVKSFRGSEAGETVYFGPYVGERLGWE